MKHLKINEAYVKGGFYVFEDVVNTFKKRVDECISIAKKHDFSLIQELNDTNASWKIVLVFVNDIYPNWPDDKDSPDEFAKSKAFEMYHSFSNEIDKLRPTLTKYFDKRFLSRVDLDRFDIKDWEKSPKLSDLNNKIGIMEAMRKDGSVRGTTNRNPAFVNCQVWMDF